MYLCPVCRVASNLFFLYLCLLCGSRGEAEGPNCDCQRPPWQAHQGVQPHQPGAQPAGQETEEGMKEPE